MATSTDSSSALAEPVIQAVAQKVKKLYEDLGEKRLYTIESIRYMQLLLDRIHDIEELRHAEVSKTTKYYTFKDGDGKEHELKHLRIAETFEHKDSELPEGTTTMTFENALGEKHQFEVPLVPWLYWENGIDLDVKPVIYFLSYQQTIFDPTLEALCPRTLADIEGGFMDRPITPDLCSSGGWQSLAVNYIPMYFGYDLCKTAYIIDPDIGDLEEVDHERMEELKKDSEAERDEIVKYVEEAKGTIKEIVCLGLNTMFGPEGTDCTLPQHYTVLDLADRLDVPVIFQSLKYVVGDKEFLRSTRPRESTSGSLKIDFCDSPEGLYAIDKSTLVFTTGQPDLPIRQLVADLTHEYGGPAAIFCAPVKDAIMKEWSVDTEMSQFRTAIRDWTVKKGRYGTRKKTQTFPDPVNKHVFNMLKGFREVLNIDTWYAQTREGRKGPYIPSESYNRGCSLYIKKGSADP